MDINEFGRCENCGKIVKEDTLEPCLIQGQEESWCQDCIGDSRRRLYEGPRVIGVGIYTYGQDKPRVRANESVETIE